MVSSASILILVVLHWLLPLVILRRTCTNWRSRLRTETDNPPSSVRIAAVKTRRSSSSSSVSGTEMTSEWFSPTTSSLRVSFVIFCSYVCVFLKMNEWMNEWRDEWKDGWMEGWVDEWMDEWNDGWMNEWMDEWMDKWMDGWMDGWMNEWMDE